MRWSCDAGAASTLISGFACSFRPLHGELREAEPTRDTEGVPEPVREPDSERAVFRLHGARRATYEAQGAYSARDPGWLCTGRLSLRSFFPSFFLSFFLSVSLSLFLSFFTRHWMDAYR